MDAAGYREDGLARAEMPASYAAQMVELVARFGIARDTLLEGTGVDPAVLEQPEGRIGTAESAALAMRALELTGEPGLGFYHGLQLKLSTHGRVGILAMASATLRDAVLVFERYAALRTPHVRMRHYREGEHAVLELNDSLPSGKLRVFVLESLVTALVQMARALLGRPISGSFDLPYPEPEYFARFAHLWPGPARFNQPACRMLLPDSLLDEGLQMADSVTAKQMARECEQELARGAAFTELLLDIRRRLRAARGAFPTLSQMAREHRMSERTLKRQLAARGTSYRNLVDEVRRERALELLSGSMSIEHVATELGYSEASNFHRAFRRWFGASPDAWRKQRPQSVEAE
jgi:AraC-like DNA-binding protein